MMVAYPAVEVRNVSKAFGKLQAVDHADFQVAEGEIFGFLGPNGAGKSTLIKILISLLAPDQGQAFVCGYDVDRQPYDAKRQFGVVPEESNVYTEISTWDNLMFTAQIYRIPLGDRKKRIETLLEQFGLQGKKNDRVFTLSKGMRQRLSLAMALIHEPKVLFLDEPILGLDVQSAQMIKSRLRELNQNGTTIFFTTHQIDVADDLCQRVAIINQGEIVAIESPENLKAAIEGRRSVEVVVTNGGTTKQYAGLTKLPGVTQAFRQGEKIRLYTSEPVTVLTGVMEYATLERLPVQAINTNGPSLEDVFVAMTGKGMGMARKKHPGMECKGCPVKEECESEKDQPEDAPKKHHSGFLKGSCEH
jgi:ABC-2 type transport system ATP-binding protein